MNKNERKRSEETRRDAHTRVDTQSVTPPSNPQSLRASIRASERQLETRDAYLREDSQTDLAGTAALPPNLGGFGSGVVRGVAKCISEVKRRD